MNFNQFLTLAQKQHPRLHGRFRGRLLALDPGELTGWSIWDSHDNAARYEMFACGQLPTWDKDAPHMVQACIRPAVHNFAHLLQQHTPDMVVMEAYRVYDWKAESHSWSDVPTLRIIGCFETYLHQRNLSYYFQTAQVAKHLITDDRLKEWGFFQKGQRHSRDSMRHGLYFLLFGPQGKQA